MASLVDTLSIVKARYDRRTAQKEADRRVIEKKRHNKASSAPGDKKKVRRRKLERPMKGIMIPRDASPELALQIERKAKRSAQRKARWRRHRQTISASKCERCGASVERVKLELHHDDYSRPDVVRVFCRSCHRKHHWERGELAE